MKLMCPVPHERALVIDTLGLRNSSTSPKIYLIISREAKKRRCRYVIYKRINTSSYYSYMNDENNILEIVK
jgi:hypothetical protein